ELLLVIMSTSQTSRLAGLALPNSTFDIHHAYSEPSYPENDRARFISWASLVHAEENASSCPTLSARNTWYDCSTIGYALQPQSQRAFQSRQISRMPWEEKAGLPDRRQVVVLPAPGQDGSGRNWATNPPNRSR